MIFFFLILNRRFWSGCWRWIRCVLYYCGWRFTLFPHIIKEQLLHYGKKKIVFRTKRAVGFSIEAIRDRGFRYLQLDAVAYTDSHLVWGMCLNLRRHFCKFLNFEGATSKHPLSAPLTRCEPISFEYLKFYRFETKFSTNFAWIFQDAVRFSKQIERSLADMKNLFEEYQCLKKLANGSPK